MVCETEPAPEKSSLRPPLIDIESVLPYCAPANAPLKELSCNHVEVGAVGEDEG